MKGGRNVSREIDYLIFEHIFNHEKDYVDYLRENDFKAFPIVNNYSTSIQDAWLVVEKLGREFLVRKRLGGMDYRAWIDEKGDNTGVYSHGKTAPLAICRVALKTVGIDYKNL
jgi:hypothetical protein